MGRWYDNASLAAPSVTDVNALWTIFERVGPFNPPVTLTMARFRVNTAVPNTRYRLAVYDDVAGVPTNLLAQTSPFLVVDNTTYEVNLNSAVTVEDGLVWVARQFDTSAIVREAASEAANNYIDTTSGGYAAGFPAVAVAAPYVEDEAWMGVFDVAKVAGLPQGCYKVEYSLDGAIWIDISGFTNSVRMPRRSRRFSEIQPQSTDVPIVAMGKRAAERATIMIMYTENDAAAFNVLRQRFENNTLLMMRWTPAGGAFGDYTFTTDTVYSYIVDMETPGADSSSSAEPLTAVFTVITQEVTQGTVP